VKAKPLIDLDSLSTAQLLFAIAAPALLLSIIAGWQDHRQHRRRDLDRISPVPWRPISIFAAFVAVACFATAIHAG
jgi:hypothetical protein